jgi:hypothetical protein
LAGKLVPPEETGDGRSRQRRPSQQTPEARMGTNGRRSGTRAGATGRPPRYELPFEPIPTAASQCVPGRPVVAHSRDELGTAPLTSPCPAAEVRNSECPLISGIPSAGSRYDREGVTAIGRRAQVLHGGSQPSAAGQWLNDRSLSCSTLRRSMTGVPTLTGWPPPTSVRMASRVAAACQWHTITIAA